MKIRWHLMLLVAAALVPVLVFAAVMIVERRREEWADVERALLDTARALSLALDRELEISIRALQTLGTSEHLDSGDLARFYVQAGRALKAQDSWSTIVVFDSDARQVLNLMRPFGSPLPEGAPSNPGVKNTIALKRPLVSNLFFGRLAGEQRIAVNVPVVRNGAVKYVLGANISPLALHNLLQQQNVAPGWLATVIDANKLTLARNRDGEKFFGKAASASFAAKTGEAKEGAWRGVTLDGDEVHGVAVRSDLSGWAVGLAAPVAVVEAPMRRALLMTSIGGISLLFIGIVLAAVFGRRIAGPIAALSAAAAAIGRGETPKTATSPIAEANQVARALEEAAVSRARAERQTRENLDRIRGLRDIGAAITSSLDLRTILAVLLEKIEIVLPIAAICAVRLIDRETGRSEFLASRGVNEEEWRASRAGTRLKQVVATGKPLAILDLDRDPQTVNREILRKHGLVSYLGLPLTARGEVLGVLSIYTARRHEFTAEEIEFFNTLAGEAAIAIQNAQLFEKVDLSRRELELTNEHLQKSVKRLSGLYTALAPLTPAESIPGLLNGILERLMEATGADAALIRLHDRTTGDYPLAGQRGFSNRYVERVATPPAGGAVDWVFQNRVPIIAADIAAEPRLKGKIQLQLGLRSCAVLPLKTGAEVRGVIHLASRKRGYFDPEQKDHLLAIARQMEIALENRELFDTLKASRDELERANRVKDEFLSVMSHELRTPLSIVIGYIGMMKEGMFGNVSPKQEDVLQKVLSRAAEQLGMINDIMQTAQLEAHGGGAYREAFDLHDLLKHLKSDYKMHGEKKGVALIWDYPDAPVPIRADLPKLKQILQNLVNNALKFTDEGIVKVTARVEECGRPEAARLGPHALIEFTVSDTGVGIAADKLDLIFNKFFQVDSSETRLFGGVGLGLFIVKKYTDLLGGEVAVASRPGKGSTFTVRIPSAP